MLKITYKEYLKYEELNRKNNNYNQVKEESENYTYDKNNEHDKVFRDLLSIKEEALILINKALKPKEKIKEEIELYNNRFITSKYKDRESDIIYKVKNKNIFFIIEHQSTIDYSMVYRMLEYSIEIMRQIIQGKENKRKTYKYPLIIPIVIYTGDKKWDAKLSMKEIKERVEWYEEQEDLEEMLNKMKNRKEKSIMTLGERIRRNEREEREKARNEGRLEEKNINIKKMLLLKLDENIIKEVTGAKDKELEKVKKELEN